MDLSPFLCLEENMARRREAKQREVLPDPKYGSKLVSKFVNCMMYEGKKSTAEKIFYGAMDFIEKKSQQDPISVFTQAVENVKPNLEVKSRRVGGATYQVPVEVMPNRRTTLAIRWLINYSRARGERDMTQKLAGEILDAFNNNAQCSSVKKKIDTHKMAEANKAFAHYRWG
jgi:small subunit ribosomal protein S7